MAADPRVRLPLIPRDASFHPLFKRQVAIVAEAIWILAAELRAYRLVRDRPVANADLAALTVGHLHRYEDLVIAEVVDEDNQPVPEGKYGAKTLVTVLFSRTQPLIRYELSDRIAAAPEMAADLPFSLLAGIEGREEEVLTLGGVSVHPNVFHGALERLPVSGWQVIDDGGRVRVLLAGDANIDATVTAESVRAALERVGAHDVHVAVELVDAIPRTALGKAPLIRRAPLATAAH